MAGAKQKLSTLYRERLDKTMTRLQSDYQSILRRVARFFPETLEKAKNLAGTNYLLGVHHLGHNHLIDASYRFRLVTMLNKSHAYAWFGLGAARLRAGLHERAAEALKHALSLGTLDSETEAAKFALKHAESGKMPDSIPEALLIRNFDAVAPHYEQLYLGHLEYTAHRHVVNALKEWAQDSIIPGWNVLDLGCGTGLCGALLREGTEGVRVTGVDFSPAMAARAREQVSGGAKTYEEVKQEEALACLSGCAAATLDAITAAGFVEYCGEPEKLLTAAAAALKQGGRFSFTFIPNPEDEEHKALCHAPFKPAWFAYTEEYIRALLKRAGLEIDYLEFVQSRNDMKCMLCVAKKPLPSAVPEQPTA